MPRRAREKSKTGIYHVMLRGINRQVIFEEDEDFEQFLEVIKGYRVNYSELKEFCDLGSAGFFAFSVDTGADALSEPGIDNAGKTDYSGIADMWNPITEGVDYIRGTDAAPVSFAEQPENLDLDYISSLLHEPFGESSGTVATKAEAENPQPLNNYVNKTLDAQNKYVDRGVNARNGFIEKGVEGENGYIGDVAERVEAINQAWDDYVNKSANAQGGYIDNGAGAMNSAVDRYAEGAGDDTVTEGAGEKVTTGSFDDLPSNAQNSYKGYEANGWKGNYSGQTPGTKAGKTYQNADDLLPKTDSSGNRVTYREFDINSPTQGVGRDAERFVVGSDGSVYYTDSHYGQRTSPAGLPPFVKIK